MPNTQAAIYDGSLTADLPNATLDGTPLRLNPTSTQLSYTVKTSQTTTVGGLVVQVYGVDLHDIVVQGQFGTGGWVEQEIFFAKMHDLADKMVVAQRVQPDRSQLGIMSSTPPVLPTGSVRFTFPLLGYDFLVWLKDYASIGGEAVEVSAANFNPSWQLTLTIENDNTGLIKTKVANRYISRIAFGLGSGELGPNGQLNPYMAEQPGKVTQFLAQEDHGSTFSQYLAQAWGTTASGGAPAPTSSPSASAGSPTSQSGNAASIWNFLVGKGLSGVAAAGIMGNLQQESSYDPQAVQGGSPSATPPWSQPGGSYGTGGYGIAQWTSTGRQQALQSFADASGGQVSSLSVQLNFFWQELTGAYSATLAALRGATSPSEAAVIFEQGYEAAGTPDMTNRQSYAQQAYQTFNTTAKG